VPKQYLWAKGICRAIGKAWGEDRLYYWWEAGYSKWTSVNHEQESPAFMRGEYVKELIIVTGIGFKCW